MMYILYDTYDVYMYTGVIYKYICIYVYIYIHTRICIHIYMYLLISTYTCFSRTTVMVFKVYTNGDRTIINWVASTHSSERSLSATDVDLSRYCTT